MKAILRKQTNDEVKRLEQKFAKTGNLYLCRQKHSEGSIVVNGDNYIYFAGIVMRFDLISRIKWKLKLM